MIYIKIATTLLAIAERSSAGVIFIFIKYSRIKSKDVKMKLRCLYTPCPSPLEKGWDVAANPPSEYFQNLSLCPLQPVSFE